MLDKLKIGNVCRIRNGYSFLSTSFKDEGVPVIRISDIEQGTIDLKKTVKVDEKYIYDDYIIDNGDILIAMSGATTGKFGIYKSNVKAYQNQRVGCFKIKNSAKLNNLYLLHLLKKIKNRIEKDAYGGGQPNISSKKIESYEINLPPLEDQIRIASLLSCIEELIAKRKESIRLLDEFVKSTFLEIFGDPVRNEKGWEKSKLKEHAIVRIGPFGSLLHKEDYIENGIPLVNPSHIFNMKIYPDFNLTISETKKIELESYLLFEGDIILGRRGEIGRAGLITKKESGFLCGTGSMFVRPSNVLNSIYLIYFLSSKRVKEILESLAKGVTMKNLNSGSIEELDILIPPISIQNKFNSVVEKVEAMKIKLNNSHSELERLYGAVSQRAFRGEK